MDRNDIEEVSGGGTVSRGVGADDQGGVARRRCQRERSGVHVRGVRRELRKKHRELYYQRRLPVGTDESYVNIVDSSSG